MRKLDIVLITLTLLASCTLSNTSEPTKTPMPMANNFSFIFQYTACGEIPLDALYTSSSVLIHTPITEYDSITIPFHLTDIELRMVYEKIIEIDYFSYQSNFTIPPGYAAVTEVPASTYLINVTNGDQNHIVYWVGGSSTHTDYPKAIQLMELFNLIQDIIHDHPEYQQLPPPSAGCA